VNESGANESGVKESGGGVVCLKEKLPGGKKRRLYKEALQAMMACM
jgi:hypothetical protein